ncbi:Uncharacterized protein QTN25_006432 [Entamoeba marina]
MKTTIVPQRVTLFNFATQNTSGNKMCLLKTILIPTASYSITKGHPLPATTSLILSALIDYAYTPIIKEPSMAPLLSQFLDKMLLGSVVVSLASVKRIPGRTASTVFARDILLSCGSLLHRYLAFPHPIHWDQFFDVNHYTSFSIAPTYFGRLNSCMTTLLVVSVLLNWSFKPPVTRAFVSLLPKIMDFCSIFSFMEYFLPPTMAKQKRFGVLSSLFI